MDKFKILLLISILKYSVITASPAVQVYNCPHYSHVMPWFPECNSKDKQYEDNTNNNGNNNPCPGYQSHISANDIEDLIDRVMKEIQVEENLVNSYLEKAEDINEKYLSDLNDYQERIVNRPQHIKHILEDMAKKRQSIEPIVNGIVDKAKEIKEQNEEYQNMLSHSDHLLGVFLSIKKICDKNCDHPNIDIELDLREIYDVVPVTYPTTYACWKLSELHDLIKDKLENFVDSFEYDLSILIKQCDDTYKDQVQSYKNNLKKAALKRYGSIMYDILSLQDDVYHFEEDINEIQIDKQLEEIKKNNLNIEQHLRELQTNIEKYRIQCLSCPVKFNYLKFQDTPVYFDSNIERVLDAHHIDDFIDKKIEDIKTIINKNLTEIFAELDDCLNNENFDDIQVDMVHSVRDVTFDIERERNALDALKDDVPMESIHKISELVQDSNELLKVLQKVKEFFDNVLQYSHK